MTNIEAYVSEMEKSGSNICYVSTKTLRQLLNVAEAVMEHLCDYRELECQICTSLKELDGDK